METINCPWCRQRTSENALECRKCGGPLTPPIGDDPGPSPPLPPRKLPKGYKRRMFFTNSIPSLVGGIFLLVGMPIGIVFTILGITLPGMVQFIIIGGSLGTIFTLLGGGMLYYGIQEALGKIRPFEHGQATVGEVIDIYRDHSISVNGRNPWAILYTFEALGQPYEGKVNSWKYSPKTQAVGNKVFVLYMTEDPDQNVLYPPA